MKCKKCGREIGWAKLVINPLIQFWKHKEETNCTNPEPLEKCAYCGHKNPEFVDSDRQGCNYCLNLKIYPEPEVVEVVINVTS